MTDCPDCGVPEGRKHRLGCDVEVCARCGSQAFACQCVYLVNEIDPKTLEQDHPEIYANGPTPEMYTRWDKEWGHRPVIWTGERPGAAECREYGWFAKMTANGWQSCAPTDEGAVEDLNRLNREASWDPLTQQRIRRN